MAAVRTSAVKSQAASLLRPEPQESLLLNSPILTRACSLADED